MNTTQRREGLRETNRWFKRARYLYALKAYPVLNDRRRSVCKLNVILDEMALKMILRGFCYRSPQFNASNPTRGSLRQARQMIGNQIYRVWLGNQPGLLSYQSEWWNFCQDFGWSPRHGEISRS